MSLPEEVAKLIEERRSFVVEFDEAGNPKVSGYRGISKMKISRDELKGVRRGRRRVPEAVLRTLRKVTAALLERKLPFKVLFGKDEVTISLDLDHFIRIYPDRVVVAGFASLDEEPVRSLKDVLSEHGQLKLLRPLR